MTSAMPDPVSDALDAFMKGAKTLFVGYYLDNLQLKRKGGKMITQAMTIIDGASPTGRDVLLPLLDHADEGIRVTAACGLWQSHLDLVIPLLEGMERMSITEAGQIAMITLITKGRFNPCGSDPRYPNLYGDESNPNRWHDDQEYRAAILSDAIKH